MKIRKMMRMQYYVSWFILVGCLLCLYSAEAYKQDLDFKIENKAYWAKEHVNEIANKIIDNRVMPSALKGQISQSLRH